MVQIYPGVTIPPGVTISSAPPVTVGSLMFQQSSLVTTTDTDPLSLGTGDYTVEFWYYYPKSIGNPAPDACLFGKWNSSTSAYEYILQGSATANKLEWVVSGSYTFKWTPTGDAWNHVAIVAQSGNVRIFLDGVPTFLVAQTGPQPNNTGAPFSIGGRDNNNLSYSYFGNITNLRIVPGQAVYLTTFTPSTHNLTPTQTANQNGIPSQAITSGTALLLTTPTGAGYLGDSSSNNYILSELDNGVPVTSSSFSPFNSINTSFTIQTTNFTTATVGGDMVNLGGSTGFSLTIVNSTYGVGHTQYTINLSTLTGSTGALITILKDYWATNGLSQTNSYMFDVTWGAGSSSPQFGTVCLGFVWIDNQNTVLHMSPVNTAYPWQMTGGTTNIYTIPPAPTPLNGTYKFPASFNLHTPLYSGDDNWTGSLPVNLMLSLDAAGYTSGPWVDTVSGLSFTLYNGVSYSSDGGGSLQFVPGSSQYAECTSSLSSLNTWTVETWHYYAGGNVGTHPTIITEVYEGFSINYALGSLSSNSPNLESGFSNGAWRTTPTGYTLTSGAWYQIVGTYDGSTIKLYVNNTLINQTSYTYSPQSDNHGIRLMRRWDLANYWGGKLAIVKVFEGAIDQTGVTASWDTNKARFGL